VARPSKKRLRQARLEKRHVAVNQQLAALERAAVDEFVLVVCTACGLEQSVAVDVPCVVCGCDVAVTSPRHAAAVAALLQRCAAAAAAPECVASAGVFLD
jgi:hypothetical protein